MSVSDAPDAIATRKIFQFSIRTLLWATVVLALALACYSQMRQLRWAKQALQRTAWADGDVNIPNGKFRLLVNKIIDDDDIKVCVLRVEVYGQHMVSADGQSSVTSTPAPWHSLDLQYAEVKIVMTYDSMDHHLIELTRVGSATGYAGGRSIYPLTANADPKQLMNITAEPGLYDIGTPLEIYQLQGNPVMLNTR